MLSKTIVVFATCGLLSPVLATAALAHDVGDGDQQYRVQPGDTLSQLALDHGISPEMLARANGLVNQDLIFAGTTLVIPGATGPAAMQPQGGATYTVVAGDNLTGIAARFGVSPDAVAGANQLGNRDVVVLGATLTIPSGGASAGNAGASGAASPGATGKGSGGLASASSFDTWAGVYGVPVDLLKADAWLESGWQPGVHSPDGAIGVGQLLPDTVAFMQRRLGLQLDPWVADDNIRMSAAFLRLLLDETGWDTTLALAAYYQGLASLRAHGPLGESLKYAQLVESLRDRF